jgi:hypothetical protein
MRIALRFAAAALLAATCLGSVEVASARAGCGLQSANSKIKHVIHIQFDNVHFLRDNPNVPSDLEQMPHLLDFLKHNGTISANHHTPLISHTATDILTILTGVYGDRMGVPVANSFGFFRPDGSVANNSSFAYWTAQAGDGLPLMLADTGKTAPAPWVPFARAGCDVGAFSMANIEFESIPADVINVFGANSPEAAEAAGNRTLAQADFLGVAVHCAQGSPLCSNPHAKPDLLPDEPGGYVGFSALFGNKYVQPVISPAGPVKDLDGNVIADVHGNPGFPNIFSPLATQSLGYAATMLEAGIPVVYVYIADAHDQNPAPNGPHSFGPGEQGYVRQLAAYDLAFQKFFDRLSKDGITKDNTLFVVTADENDHFVGGPPSPATCDGIHTPCTYANVGEIVTALDRLLATQRNDVTPFTIHFDDAPTFYLVGDPTQTDPMTRTMEQDAGKLTAINPITGNTDKLAVFLADRAEMQLLHMITASPARSPNFTMFGDPDYFHQTSTPNNHTNCAQPPACVQENPGFAWNHGDVQKDITRTWMGIVGPGVRHLGVNNEVFSDHTDIRPTMLALVGLKDSYVHDGRVLAEKIEDGALPTAIRHGKDSFTDLSAVYKQLNAPLGAVGKNSLTVSTAAIMGGDQMYGDYLEDIAEVTAARNRLAGEIKVALDNAAFQNRPIGEDRAEDLIARARTIIDRVADMAEKSSGRGDRHASKEDR